MSGFFCVHGRNFFSNQARDMTVKRKVAPKTNSLGYLQDTNGQIRSVIELEQKKGPGACGPRCATHRAWPGVHWGHSDLRREDTPGACCFVCCFTSGAS